MKISVRNLEPTKVKLTITVDPEEFNPYLDAARKEIAKQVNIPGFRKGHVPGKIIDQRIGFAAVAGEAVNNGVPEFYSKALEEKKIHPMSQPEIDVQEVPESAKDETKLKFTATVERRPDIELPELDGLEIDVPKAQVTDEDVNNRLESLRQRRPCGCQGRLREHRPRRPDRRRVRRLPGRRELRARLRHHAGRSGRGPRRPVRR